VITHPEKVLFPDDGITKGELAAYYEAVAPFMLPHLSARPITMERFPSGIAAKGFMQKDVVKGFPEWLERIEVPKHGGTTHYPLVRDVRSLLWLANQNCITPHVWTSRAPDLMRPDLCVFDLDPSIDDPEVLRSATLLVRDVLAELGLRSWLKTSGSKGFHIVVPVDASATYEQVWHFAHGVSILLAKRDPEHLTLEFIKADRGDRILIDTGRNGHGATFAAAYAVRARRGAPVSAPCAWWELENDRVGPQSFRLRSMAERLARVGDVWADLHAHEQPLGAPLERVESMLTDADWQEARAASTRSAAGSGIAAPPDLKVQARELYKEGKYREAADAYQRAAKHNTADAAAFAGLGGSLLSTGDIRNAIAAYQKAVRLEPEVSGFQAALGRAYLKKGDRARARAAYSKALELDPNNQAARSGMASAKAR